MTQLQSAFLSLIEYAGWMYLIIPMSEEFFDKRRKPILLFAVLYVLIDVLSFILPGFLVKPIFLICMVLFVHLFLEKRFLMSILICTCSWFVYFFISSATIGLLFLSGHGIQYIFSDGLIVNISTLVFSILIYKFVPIHKIIKISKYIREFAYIITAFSVLILGVFYYLAWVNQTFALANSLANIIVTMQVMVLAYFVVRVVSEKNAKKIALKKYNDYTQNLSVYDASNPQEHDKHLQALYCLAIIDDDEKTAKHIEKYLQNFENRGTFIDEELPNLNQKVLAAFLYIKISRLQALGTNCKLYVYSCKITFKMKKHKLLDAVNILIDNAWGEAGEKNNSGYVSVSKDEKGDAFVSILNKYTDINNSGYINVLENKHAVRDIKGRRRLCTLDKILNEEDIYIFLDKLTLDGENYAKFKLILSPYNHVY